MRVESLDHINIITDRMEETARFYSDLLQLERRNAPPPLTPGNAAWMFDEAGRAIIHINSVDCPRTYDRTVEPGSLTGALHHVALKCEGYDSMIAKLKTDGVDFQENYVAAINLRQIFTADPNNILLELNFFGE